MPRNTSRYDWLSIEPNGRGGFTAYGHGTYEPTSVLAGQYMRCYLESFDTIEQAQAAYPAAEYVAGSTRVDTDPGPCAPAWFDPAAAGERWDEDY